MSRKTPWNKPWAAMLIAILVSIGVHLLFNFNEPAHATPMQITDWDYDAQYIPLPDGKKVICIFYHGHYGTSVTCDWGHKK